MLYGGICPHEVERLRREDVRLPAAGDEGASFADAAGGVIFISPPPCAPLRAGG